VERNEDAPPRRAQDALRLRRHRHAGHDVDAPGPVPPVAQAPRGAGIDEHGRCACRVHPRLWVWAKGGITDNPGADAGDRDWYASQTFNSEAERSVRLGGGFADFSGTPVFDLQALEQQADNLRGRRGRRVRPRAGAQRRRPAGITVTEKTAGTSRVRPGVDPGGLASAAASRSSPAAPGHKYVIGHDSAYGLRKGRLRRGRRARPQHGRAGGRGAGHWGDQMWAEVLFGLAWHYNQAFLCGERQVGLMVMRRLHDEMRYTYQYFRRDEDARDRRQSDDSGTTARRRHDHPALRRRSRRATWAAGCWTPRSSCAARAAPPARQVPVPAEARRRRSTSATTRS
jgi:hypothetical protein